VHNTSFEAIKKLTVMVAKHEMEWVETRKQLAAAVKASASAANKADEGKKIADSFLKRLTKFETK
jgi:hypothetical protein